MFQWACDNSPAWQPRYFLALVRWHHGEQAAAEKLLSACGDEPAFGPFYAARAQLLPQNAVERPSTSGRA